MFVHCCEIWIICKLNDWSFIIKFILYKVKNMSKLKIRFQIPKERKFLMKVTFQFVTRIFKTKKKKNRKLYTIYSIIKGYIRSFDLFFYFVIYFSQNSASWCVRTKLNSTTSSTFLFEKGTKKRNIS